MQLGQFPAEGDAPLGAKSRREVVQRGAQLVGRFVEDDRPLLALQLGQPLPLLLFVHGQEPLEHPAGGILAGDRQRRDAGRCGRHRHHPDAPRQRIPHDDLAGVGDAGHPGVRAEGAVLARLDAAEDALALLQGMLVVADHRFFQAEEVEQLHGHAGVLGGDEVRRAEGRRHAGRHVIEIADGGRDDV